MVSARWFSHTWHVWPAFISAVTFLKHFIGYFQRWSWVVRMRNTMQKRLTHLFVTIYEIAYLNSNISCITGVSLAIKPQRCNTALLSRVTQLPVLLRILRRYPEAVGEIILTDKQRKRL